MAGEYITDLELAGIRADAEQLFKDSATFTRRDYSARSLNTSTAALTIPETTLHTDLRCNVWPIMSRRDRFDEFGGGLIFTRQYRIEIPYDTDDLQVRDIATVTSSDDTQLVGRRFEVRDVVVASNNAFRVVTVQDSAE